jgi:P2 family phage contractile tail tube protein
MAANTAYIGTIWNVYFDGAGKVGTCVSFKIPKLEIKTKEVDCGGMGGPIDVPMGKHEKLEGSFVMLGLNPQMFALLKGKLSTRTDVELRQVVEKAGEEVELGHVIIMRALIKSIDEREVKSGEVVDTAVKFTAITYDETLDGQELYSIDMENIKRSVEGRDVLAFARSFLGA